MMDKNHIVDEIKRTASENNGQPLGTARFQSATGIKKADWYGKFWVRWNDALKEAGFAPNKFNEGQSDKFLLDKLCEFIRELGHFPVTGELLMKTRQDKTFPYSDTFNRFGNKRALIQKVIAHCEQNQWHDIIALCPKIEPETELTSKRQAENIEEIGYVYLMKHGKYYKIGRTNSIGRRSREIGVQLPEQTNIIHYIKTDDPAGIETYWHHRFEPKHANGEWFALTTTDVAAFRKRNFM